MLIDVSHVVESGMITYKGLPAPLVCDYLSREASRKVYAPGTEFHIGRIDMVANTGTYLDAPFHRFADGIDVSELPLERIAHLPGLVVRVNPAAGARSRAKPSRVSTFAAKPCWFRQDGTRTGEQTSTSRAIHF